MIDVNDQFADVQRRTLDQNSLMWPILGCFARQRKWPVNGSEVFMSPEDWKDVLTAAFKKEQIRLATALDGSGVVMLGQRTRKFGKRKMAEFIDFLQASAHHLGVVIPQEWFKSDGGL